MPAARASGRAERVAVLDGDLRTLTAAARTASISASGGISANRPLVVRRGGVACHRRWNGHAQPHWVVVESNAGAWPCSRIQFASAPSSRAREARRQASGLGRGSGHRASCKQSTRPVCRRVGRRPRRGARRSARWQGEFASGPPERGPEAESSRLHAAAARDGRLQLALAHLRTTLDAEPASFAVQLLLGLDRHCKTPFVAVGHSPNHSPDSETREPTDLRARESPRGAASVRCNRLGPP